MSFGPCEVVKIVSDNPEHGGYVVINASDYDEGVHTLYEGASAPDHVQEPHVTTAEAAGNILPPPRAIPADQKGWGSDVPAPPPVEPQAAPEAAPEPVKAKK